ncbi:VOC family protein [Roseateles paludis]|jgi:catechol 2,3-dioxygenase-like lactoylglutathione lyase family enzyme|uniref:VOC family protein n=1 Tax=Roseateles paludis TaxID=3145238 RepID=A0ABV0G5F6_9BURK
MILSLNHINLRAPKPLLDVLRDFYRDVLGLQPGPRPPFDTPGYWLYAGGQPVLHLAEQRADETPRVPATAPGVFDHTAFTASDPDATAAVLRQHGVSFEVSLSELTRQHQFFFADPAGNLIELNFPIESQSHA